MHNNSIHNPHYLLKIPTGAFAAANELGILSDLVYYYQLKSMNINGVFRRGCIKNIAQKYECSESSIRKKMRRLIDMGWIRSNDGNHYLRKYDVVFATLGYNINQRLRLVRLKVASTIFHPKHNHNPATIKDLLMAVDIRSNLKKQSYSIRSLSNSRLHTEKQNQNVATLSCRGVAQILGYKTATQGWHIEQRLCSVDLMSIGNRKKYRGPNEALLHQKGHYQVGSKVIQQLPNLIRVLKSV